METFRFNSTVQGHALDVLRKLPSESVHACVTSPPHIGSRSKGRPVAAWGGIPTCEHDWEPDVPSRCRACDAWRCDLGQEETYDCLAWASQTPPCKFCTVCHFRAVFAEVFRVLRSDGSLIMVMGDAYAPEDAGRVKAKDMVGLPYRVALALQSDGFFLRQDNVWVKPGWVADAPKDRTTRSHEFVFHFTKSIHYFYDAYAVREPLTITARSRGAGGQLASQATHRNRRSVWSIAPDVADSDSFPQELVSLAILSTTSDIGCCPKCAAPWKREVDGCLEDVREPSEMDRLNGTFTGKGWDYVPPKTIGWAPTCSCKGVKEDQLLPPAVLDPFMGSGTVGLVAIKTRRNYFGIELNPDRATAAGQRINDESLQQRLF